MPAASDSEKDSNINETVLQKSESNDRSQKLAAAKKRLKQFQDKKSTNKVRKHGDGKLESESPVAETESSDIKHLNGNNNSSAVSGASVSGTAENLLHLSRQINGIISGNGSSSTSKTIQELESRNVELASLLEQHTQTIDQLTLQISQQREQNSKLQASLSSERHEGEDRNRRELAAVKEQLQNHVQTIGLLVAEKTELVSQLAHSQKVAQQRQHELTDTTAKLKASKARLSEAEKREGMASSSSGQLEVASKELCRELEKARHEVHTLTVQKTDLEQTGSELRSKLQAKSEALRQAEDQVRELRKQKELASVYIQQLSNTQVNKDKEKESAVRQLLLDKAQLTERVEFLSGENQRLVQQYKEYVNTLTGEKHALQKAQAALETQTAALQDELVDVRRMADVSQSELSQQQLEAESREQSALADVKSLRFVVEELESRLSVMTEEKQRLVEMVQERETLCSRLREEHRSARDSQSKLVESVQGDKAALSRALQQNASLKKEVTELQEGFMRVTNQGAALTQQLQSEQHLAKELVARLEEQEEELRDVRAEMSEKEAAMRVLKQAYQSAKESLFDLSPDSSSVLGKEGSPPPEMMQRLQQELASAQSSINQLSAQNHELKSLLHQAQSPLASSTMSEEDNSPTRVRNNSTSAALYASINQLEKERNQLMEAVRESSPITQDQFQQLQDKYNSCMRRVAQLEDEKERLEHSLIQLEIETETIGEYVTLYQHQRRMLHQRELEQAAQLEALGQERAELDLRLSELHTLARTLSSSSSQPLPSETRSHGNNVHSSCSKSQTQVNTAARMLDILTELHAAPVSVPNCSCCHGRLIDL